MPWSSSLRRATLWTLCSLALLTLGGALVALADEAPAPEGATAPPAAEAPAAEAPARGAAVEARVDSARSTLTFLSNAPSERIEGQAAGIEGAFRFSPENPGDVSGSLQVPVSALRSGNSLRDRHIAGRDWLLASSHPHIRFDLQRVEVRSTERSGMRVDISGVAHGTLTLRGATRPTTADITVSLALDTQRVRVQFSMQANLRAHDIPGRRNSIGREVAENIEIQGTVHGSW